MRAKLALVLLAVLSVLGISSFADATTRYRPYRYRPYIYYPYPYSPYPIYWGPSYSYWHGAVRTQVEPREAQVYVDGYYAGSVDDFDGTFQRLYLRPGKHQIELRLAGYRTFRERILAVSGETVKLRHAMERLGPGEVEPPPPEAAPLPQGDDREDRDRGDVFRTPGPDDRRREEPAPAVSRFGMLALRVQPQGAEVWIDGEVWGRLEGEEEMVIHVPAGRHRIQIRKEGYSSFEEELTIQAGTTVPRNVRLSR